MLGLEQRRVAALAHSAAWKAIFLCLFTGSFVHANTPQINPQLLAEFTFQVTRYTTWPKEPDYYQIHAVGMNLAQRKTHSRRSPIGNSKANPFSLPSAERLEPFRASHATSRHRLRIRCHRPVSLVLHHPADPADQPAKAERDEAYDFCKSTIIDVHSNRGRIEFDADLSQARKVGLRLSARMLRLARQVD